MKFTRKKITKNVVLLIVLFVIQILTFSLSWCLRNFGNIGIEEIIFTINMPLKSAATDYFHSYFKDVLCTALLLTLVEGVIFFIPVSKSYKICLNIKSHMYKIRIWPLEVKGGIAAPVVVIWVAILLFRADSNFGVVDYIKSQSQVSTFIEEEYVNPNDVDIKFPNEKRNLICIYIESAESSAQDRANGGLMDENLIPEMTMLAKDNVSFSQSDKLEGAAVAPACGWTASALVAHTSGLPLKLYTYNDKGVDNSMDDYVSFMPGAVTLGDILDKEGYNNLFMAGSDFTFGGRRDYFRQHGNYEIWDYYTAKQLEKIPEDYKVNWGFEDQKLYEYAKEELLNLAKEKKPFNFSMLTVDTHTGGGYLCELCPDNYENDYYDVWNCASKQLYEFVEWIKQQDFYENTTIYIAGDHCSMQKDFLEGYEYDKHEGGTVRKVYNAFVNPAIEPVNMKNRQFTTLDFFPTVLASIGAEIEGERLGLGTNLFADYPTLSEEFGYTKLFEELNRKSVFYNENILYPN